MLSELQTWAKVKKAFLDTKPCSCGTCKDVRTKEFGSAGIFGYIDSLIAYRYISYETKISMMDKIFKELNGRNWLAPQTIDGAKVRVEFAERMIREI